MSDTIPNLRKPSLLASISPQQQLGMSRYDTVRSQGPPVLHPTREMSDEPSPMSPSPASVFLRARSSSSVLRFGRDPVARDQAPAPKMPPPLEQANSQERKWTQEDQDETDSETRKKAMKELVQSWMDRLQLISVITTFFAATEAQLLGIVVPGVGETFQLSRIEQAANAGLAGALVVHAFAAILSFFAAFFLIRYRLREAAREELKVEEGLKSDISHQDHIYSSNPHLELFGPFRKGQPPTHLLENCHTLCMWLSAVGFILALAGVLCFAWALLPRSVSIFASVCMWVCIVFSIFAVYEARRSPANPPI